jgi:hypothetical protein
MLPDYSAHIDATDEQRQIILDVIARYGPTALKLAFKALTRIVVLKPRQEYRDRSPALRRVAAGVDGWPVPPAGLFVVEERTIYLRSISKMTVGHEFAHALDCALGGGVYLSGVDPRIRRAFKNARGFVTPYAASGLDEFFAESARAFVDGCNDPRSPWPAATRERLKALDATMYAILADLLPDALSHVDVEDDVDRGGDESPFDPGLALRWASGVKIATVASR